MNDDASEDINKYIGQLIDCDKCDNTGFVADVSYECIKMIGQIAEAGCERPLRLVAPDIFGYDIRVTERKVQGGPSEFDVDRFRLSSSFAIPEELTRPMPLASFLSYMALADQAKALECTQVFGQEGEDALTEYFSDVLRPVTTRGPAQEANPASIPWGKQQ